MNINDLEVGKSQPVLGLKSKTIVPVGVHPKRLIISTFSEADKLKKGAIIAFKSSDYILDIERLMILNLEFNK